MATIFDKSQDKDKMVVADIEADVFEQFLCFCYAGRLTESANNRQLLFVAEEYEVETLKSLCQTATQEISAEELTAALMI